VIIRVTWQNVTLLLQVWHAAKRQSSVWWSKHIKPDACSSETCTNHTTHNMSKHLDNTPCPPHHPDNYTDDETRLRSPVKAILFTLFISILIGPLFALFITGCFQTRRTLPFMLLTNAFTWALYSTFFFISWTRSKSPLEENIIQVIGFVVTLTFTLGLVLASAILCRKRTAAMGHP
jgi:hypothetical protein